MPWKEADVMNLRMQFVTRALREEMSFAALCREFGISAKTGYKWKQRFLDDGYGGLVDLSRRPAAHARQLDEDTIFEIVRLKQQHMRWGPAKIRELFRRTHPGRDCPSLSTVKRMLGKCGLVERRRRRQQKQTGRISQRRTATAANQVWTVDFKGWWFSSERERVQPLTVCDAYSRCVLLAQALPDSRSDTVRECFSRLFEQYGLPECIRSDNGTPFAASNALLGLSRLSAWWLALGISLDRIDPGRPDQNGSHERMHREIACEVESRVDGDLATQQAALDIWREEYNTQRPHEALGMRSPAELYVKSQRRYRPEEFELHYPVGYLRRKVAGNGCFKLDRSLINLTTALRGWHVGLQPQGSQEYRVWFAQLCLGRLNLRDEVVLPLHGEQVRSSTR